jgi:hypothetical protein
MVGLESLAVANHFRFCVMRRQETRSQEKRVRDMIVAIAALRNGLRLVHPLNNIQCCVVKTGSWAFCLVRGSPFASV